MNYRVLTSMFDLTNDCKLKPHTPINQKFADVIIFILLT